MIDTGVNDPAAALRVLYLLPTAPRALAREVYRALRDQALLTADGDAERLDAALERLDRAHAVVANAMDLEHEAPSQRSPWLLLHVDCDAPPEVTELAYRFWQRERGLPEAVEPTAAPRVEPSAVRNSVAPLPGVRTASQPDEATGPVTAPAPSGSPRLIVEAGAAGPEAVAPGERPLRIGSDPSCDIVVGAAGQRKGRTEARLWLSDGRVMLHGVAGEVSVNGHAVGWAVLDPDDRVQVGEASFRYEA